MKTSAKQLNKDIETCALCPRLRQYCQKVAAEKKRAHVDETYWGRPVPNFGDDTGRLLIVGLAPAAHGGNRTGRMFTGDRSGLWLYRAIHRAGFSNQPTSDSVSDGLKLKDCLITAIVHCAPPDNKPTPDEIKTCHPYLVRTLAMTQPQVIIALGNMAWTGVVEEAKVRGAWKGARPKFAHGAKFTLLDGTVLLGSYHPSQQNTFTGKLTEPMFDAVFSEARNILKSSS